MNVDSDQTSPITSPCRSSQSPSSRSRFFESLGGRDFEIWSRVQEEIAHVRETTMKQLEDEREERRTKFGHMFEAVNVWRQGREDAQQELVRQATRIADCEEELKKQKKELNHLLELGVARDRVLDSLSREASRYNDAMQNLVVTRKLNRRDPSQTSLAESPVTSDKLSPLIVVLDRLLQQGNTYSEFLAEFLSSLYRLSEEVNADGLHVSPDPHLSSVSELYESLQWVGNGFVTSLKSTSQNVELKHQLGLGNDTELEHLFIMQQTASELEDFSVFKGAADVHSMCNGQRRNMESASTAHEAKITIDRTCQEGEKLKAVIKLLIDTVSTIKGSLKERFREANELDPAHKTNQNNDGEVIDYSPSFSKHGENGSFFALDCDPSTGSTREDDRVNLPSWVNGMCQSIVGGVLQSLRQEFRGQPQSHELDEKAKHYLTKLTEGVVKEITHEAKQALTLGGTAEIAPLQIPVDSARLQNPVPPLYDPSEVASAPEVNIETVVRVVDTPQTEFLETTMRTSGINSPTMHQRSLVASGCPVRSQVPTSARVVRRNSKSSPLRDSQVQPIFATVTSATEFTPRAHYQRIGCSSPTPQVTRTPISLRASPLAPPLQATITATPSQTMGVDARLMQMSQATTKPLRNSLPANISRHSRIGLAEHRGNEAKTELRHAYPKK